MGGENEPRAKSSLMMHRFSKDNLTTIRRKSTHSIDQAKSAALQPQPKGGDHLLTVVTSKSFSTQRGDSLRDYPQPP
jgi:hypothetical protein